MTVLEVTGDLTVDGATTARTSLFVGGFSRVGALAVAGLTSSAGSVQSEAQVVAQSGLVSKGDCLVATSLSVGGPAQFAAGAVVAGTLACTGTVDATGLQAAFVDAGRVAVESLAASGAAPSVNVEASVLPPGVTAVLAPGSTDLAGSVSLQVTQSTKFQLGHLVQLDFAKAKASTSYVTVVALTGAPTAVNAQLWQGAGLAVVKSTGGLGLAVLGEMALPTVPGAGSLGIDYAILDLQDST